MEKYGYVGLSLVLYNFQMEKDKVKSFDLAICLLLNLTSCLSKTNDCVHVGQLFSMILGYRPKNVNALFRRAKAAVNLGKNEWACWDLMTAIEIEHNNREIWKELEEIKGVLCKDKLKDDSKNEAPIGLG
ncbi:Peptidyl-prolyl cis-trans isomerase FKBP65 [Bienertia sinuspersici]